MTRELNDLKLPFSSTNLPFYHCFLKYYPYQGKTSRFHPYLIIYKIFYKRKTPAYLYCSYWGKKRPVCVRINDRLINFTDLCHEEFHEVLLCFLCQIYQSKAHPNSTVSQLHRKKGSLSARKCERELLNKINVF